TTQNIWRAHETDQLAKEHGDLCCGACCRRRSACGRDRAGNGNERIFFSRHRTGGPHGAPRAAGRERRRLRRAPGGEGRRRKMRRGEVRRRKERRKERGEESRRGTERFQRRRGEMRRRKVRRVIAARRSADYTSADLIREEAFR